MIAGEWWLVIATPWIATFGPRETYAEIQKILEGQYGAMYRAGIDPQAGKSSSSPTTAVAAFTSTL
jgi:hypothetical protein